MIRTTLAVLTLMMTAMPMTTAEAPSCSPGDPPLFPAPQEVDAQSTWYVLDVATHNTNPDCSEFAKVAAVPFYSDAGKASSPYDIQPKTVGLCTFDSDAGTYFYDDRVTLSFSNPGYDGSNVIGMSSVSMQLEPGQNEEFPFQGSGYSSRPPCDADYQADHKDAYAKAKAAVAVDDRIVVASAKGSVLLLNAPGLPGIDYGPCDGAGEVVVDDDATGFTLIATFPPTNSGTNCELATVQAVVRTVGAMENAALPT